MTVSSHQHKPHPTCGYPRMHTLFHWS